MAEAASRPKDADHSWQVLAVDRSNVTARLGLLFGSVMLVSAVGVMAGIHADGGPPLRSSAPVVFGVLLVVSTALLAAAVAAAILSTTVIKAQQLALELAQARSDGSALPPHTTTATRSPDAGT